MAGALAAAGAHVVLNARSADALAGRLADMERWGLSAETIASDVSGSGEAAKLVETVVGRHGRLDILLSNVAGTARKPLLEQTDGDWDRVIDVTLSTGWRLARAAAPSMVAAGYGRMIFTSSINAILARPSIPGYVAAKSGLEGLVRGLAVDLGEHGITANAIAPGYFLTEGNRPLRTERPDFEAAVAARTAAGRWGDPPDLATAALYLASAASAYTTGTVLVVDGGLTVKL
jgi:gluconate 5-dehydrogenase